jgi:hypothetical protein
VRKTLSRQLHSAVDGVIGRGRRGWILEDDAGRVVQHHLVGVSVGHVILMSLMSMLTGTSVSHLVPAAVVHAAELRVDDVVDRLGAELQEQPLDVEDRQRVGINFAEGAATDDLLDGGSTSFDSGLARLPVVPSTGSFLRRPSTGDSEPAWDG